MASEIQSPKYKRVLLKISGEVLAGKAEAGKEKFGIDMEACFPIAQEIKEAISAGTEVCLVIGGGNIFRGLKGVGQGMERAQADSMGMLATVMNALAMQGALEEIGVAARVQSAVEMPKICEPFIRRRAIRHMEKGRVVIFAAGTGNPFFTTDTGAALRAAEMGCDAMLKGTQVDGVYTADPKIDPDATRFENLGYMDVLNKELRVMDATAVSLMKENHIPIVVFSIHNKGSLAEVLAGNGVCTVIQN
ncbi:UMP kinase [Hirschia litorea]|uniref:Uridylate kinase n=1 Tax=Hirschia litorea TaxID=1199156 RepID=A0ABW2IHR4_9PROT